MTRKTTKNGVKIALAALATKSIRKACLDGGISVTTLYNKTTPAQRKAALKGKVVEQVGRGPGRPKRIVPNPSNNTETLPSINLPQNFDIRDQNYVTKLERALLQRILAEEE